MGPRTAQADLLVANPRRLGLAAITSPDGPIIVISNDDDDDDYDEVDNEKSMNVRQESRNFT